nr:MAG TPA: Rap1a immunity protein [Caudoviricetes sp.]
MKKTATIFDYARMCRTYHTNCPDCPMWNEVCTFCIMDNTQVDKASEIILNWCKEHPVETRQDRFLKMFPKAKTNAEGRIVICPNSVEYDYMHGCANVSCPQCMDKYWLAEVDENE